MTKIEMVEYIKIDDHKLQY